MSSPICVSNPLKVFKQPMIGGTVGDQDCKFNAAKTKLKLGLVELRDLEGLNCKGRFSCQISRSAELLQQGGDTERPGRFKIKFIGENKAKLAGIISLIKAMKLMRKGHIAYLACVVDAQVPQA
ncbi:hypothetical protein E5676_scaffold143G002170 [Cucumis melo var. makuwa]|uniref:Uncharacterized protein n=1 Tax=Cucumis melo var. makuwa TaxID=1194695 RepID=A0A5D3C1E0_CUCMM|nr:hypothetical protein E5676_scaffold143G002170 [Cucumis melo var. makuwa]